MKVELFMILVVSVIALEASLRTGEGGFSPLHYLPITFVVMFVFWSGAEGMFVGAVGVAITLTVWVGGLILLDKLEAWWRLRRTKS